MSLQGQGHLPRSNDSEADDHLVGDYANISSSKYIVPPSIQFVYLLILIDLIRPALTADRQYKS